MRGSGSLIVRKVRFLVSPSRLRSGRGVESSVLPTTAQRHLLSHDRVSAVEDDFLDSLTTFKNIVRTTGMRNEGLSPYPPSSAWMNKVSLGRPLAVMNSAPTDINAADFHEFDNQTDAGIGLAPAWNICYYCPSSIPFIHHAGCTQRMYSSFATVRSASFGTVREQVKDEEDEEGIREHEQRSENFRDQGQDIHTSIEKVLIKDTEASSGFGSVKQNDLYEKELVRKAEETSGNLAWSEAGWTKEEVWNWPNSISMARLLSGPVLAWMILHELWSPAFIGLIMAGASDWLDGYVARRMKINSVLGSYLDPVADKVLVGSVALSMAYAGLLHPALVGLVVARDGVLMGGACVYRANSLRWQWKNWREFFRINVGGAGKVEPLFISKVNTVLQLGLIGVALLQPALSLEDMYSLVPLLSWSVAGTTTISWACYVYQYLKYPDALAAVRQMPPTHGDKKS